MRGKDLFNIEIIKSVRITPAYAGKSRTLYAEAKNYEDHPRLCGEKSIEERNPSDYVGSPPPMRGKEDFDPEDIDEDGITPAYAGKSQNRSL